MRKRVSTVCGSTNSRQGFLKVSQNFETGFALLLKTLILIEFIQITSSQFLTIFKKSEVFKIFWLSRIDGSSIIISLTIAQSRPTLHFFADPIRVDSIFTNVTEDLDILTRDTR